ncbi:hypothetical protein ABH926_000156 [Catenulispora sp. GP43]
MTDQPNSEAEAEFREFAIGRWPALVRFAYGLTCATC